MDNKLKYKECENCKDWTGCITDCMNMCGKPLDALEKFNQYRSIGTVEECREAREKQKAKKPEKKPDKYSDLTQHYYCPSCGHYFGQAGVRSVILFNKEKYCQGDNCGQAIDWSEV